MKTNSVAESSEALLERLEGLAANYLSTECISRREWIALVTGLLELARIGVEGEKDAVEIAATMMEEHAAHVKENVHGLRQFTDTEHEARAREMAGAYLTECAACIRADRTLAGIDQWIKSADAEISALQSAHPKEEK